MSFQLIEKKNIDSPLKGLPYSGKRFAIKWDDEEIVKTKMINTSKVRIDLGLCCINSTLRKQKPSVFPNRTCRVATVEKKGLEYVKNLALQNMKDVLKILRWNYKHNIRSYRLSSDMFPHINNPRVGVHHEPYGNRYSLDFAIKYLKKIGKKAHKYGIRLSFHPGQYNQIASPIQKVFENTVRDLSVHAYLLDIIEENIDVGENRGILCIHGGGTYNDKEGTITRWIERFGQLPEHVRLRLCLENCEKCYSTTDCLRICDAVNIPLIYDVHHYNCYTLLHPDEKQLDPMVLMPKVLETWKRHKLKPYFHISEQGHGRVGHHSDYIEEIPGYIFELGVSITLDVEAKAKEQAIMRLMKKYEDMEIL